MTADMRQPLLAPGPASQWDGSGLAGGTEIATPSGRIRLDTLAPDTPIGTDDAGSWTASRVERHGFVSGSLRWSGFLPPVHIEKGALGRGLPRRDLVLGSEQSVVLDGQCWPARHLVTGTTIRFLPEGAAVELYRVWPSRPLPDLLLAEGVPCRAAPAPIQSEHRDVAELAQTRLRLQRQAGQQPGRLRGHLDRANHAGLIGWAHDQANPGAPVCLEVRLDGIRHGTVIANVYRPDLATGLSAGRCGFTWQPPIAWNRASNLLVSINRIGDETPLPGSPVLLPAQVSSPELLAQALGVLTEGVGEDLAREVVAGAALWNTD
jgi:hypothetical protein